VKKSTRSLERQIQRSSIAWLEGRGCVCIKQETQHRKGIPDVLVLLPWGAYCFIEYKQPGGSLTPIQAHVHRALGERARAVVFICHSRAETIEAYAMMVARSANAREEKAEQL